MRTLDLKARKKKILVVDDEPTTVRVVQEMLEANQYEVVTALSGEEGMYHALRDKPDLILLDILMPGIDGFEVLCRLKGNEKTKDVPVVMLTAKGETSSIFKAKEYWASDYLIKPFVVEDLLSVVDKHAF